MDNDTTDQPAFEMTLQSIDGRYLLHLNAKRGRWRWRLAGSPKLTGEMEPGCRQLIGPLLLDSSGVTFASELQGKLRRENEKLRDELKTAHQLLREESGFKYEVMNRLGKIKQELRRSELANWRHKRAIADYARERVKLRERDRRRQLWWDRLSGQKTSIHMTLERYRKALQAIACQPCEWVLEHAPEDCATANRKDRKTCEPCLARRALRAP